VICDDASTDGTVALCEAFAARAPFPVRVVVNPSPVGAIRNREQAIAACTGAIVALADQDDVWRPEKLARMEAVLRGPDAPTLAFSDGDVVDRWLRPLGSGIWEAVGFDATRQARFDTGDAFVELLGRNAVAGPTAVFRVELTRVALPIPAGVRADAWLGLVAAATGRVAAVPDRLIAYRQSPGQQIGAGIASSARLRRRLIHAVPLRLRGRRERPSPLDSTVVRLEAIRDRLAALAGGPDPPHPGCLEAVEDRLDHWHLRARLPRSRWSRWPAIRAELGTGRYRRYSRGRWSAAADLVF
jgi:glycosyltransferase involved in cell wall biosynthesis